MLCFLTLQSVWTWTNVLKAAGLVFRRVFHM